jgi:hypothetical protein
MWELGDGVVAVAKSLTEIGNRTFRKSRSRRGVSAGLVAGLGMNGESPVDFSIGRTRMVQGRSSYCVCVRVTQCDSKTRTVFLILPTAESADSFGIVFPSGRADIGSEALMSFCMTSDFATAM